MHENPAVYSLANKFCVSMRGRVYRHFLVSRSSFYPVRCRHDRQDILKMQASQTKVDMKDRWNASILSSGYFKLQRKSVAFIVAIQGRQFTSPRFFVLMVDYQNIDHLDDKENWQGWKWLPVCCVNEFPALSSAFDCIPHEENFIWCFFYGFLQHSRSATSAGLLIFRQFVEFR
jgi:hypothetical protein